MSISNFGIMFHHFHDKEKHIVCQGSISEDDFRLMIRYLQKSFDIIDAEVYFDRTMNNNLAPNQICLTFDDALSCQYDIANPVLKELNITGFWFIYTSMYKGILEKLEIYRHFRFKNFSTIDVFYDDFFTTAVSNQDKLSVDIEKEIANFNPSDYLTQHSFYTDNDKLFRYLRDNVLGQENYNFIMDKMILASEYDIEENKKLLWITEEQILNLHKSKHIIGLHSHTHPTVMSEKTYDEQLMEYQENKQILESITGNKVKSISYPCNSYNRDTDKIMNELGILIGFDAVLADVSHNNLHVPRKDHAYIIKEMKE